MFFLTDKVVAGMAGVRLLSACIEFAAAVLMLKYGRVEAAIKINALLALVGPVVLLAVTGLGLVGLAGKVSGASMAIIITGISLVFIGINKL